MVELAFTCAVSVTALCDVCYTPDIDECQQSRRVCSEQQRCVNTEGSYTCEGPSGPTTDHADQCPVGYSAHPDTGECEGQWTYTTL